MSAFSEENFLTGHELPRFAMSVDVTHHTTVDLGRSLRDIGVMADRRTLLLRIRLPAASVDGNLSTQEQVCFSADGRNCSATIEYRSTIPLPGGAASCAGGHDC